MLHFHVELSISRQKIASNDLIPNEPDLRDYETFLSIVLCSFLCFFVGIHEKTTELSVPSKQT